ncbi:MAG: primosomal protein N' [Chloroflexi bacterium]|nr:primosomal protein N' [Chloroflexota bacterium]
MAYAEVAVQSGMPFRQAFSYRVPEGMTLAVGDGVLAPFGRQKLIGVVVGLSEVSAYEGETRDVLLAGERLLMPHQVALARWLSGRYLASIAECVGLMLPPDAARRFGEVVIWTGAQEPPGLSPADQRLFERLSSSDRASPAGLRRSFGGGADAAVARLVALGAAQRRLALAEAAPVPHGNVTLVSPPPLNGFQSEAATAIAQAIRERQSSTFLLHGVTGSGKTEVYLAAAEAARDHGRRAIVLVPEIVLTPQTVGRFEARFPGKVAVSHSGLTAAQRYRQWLDVRAGRATVVIGARGALFLPQPDVGLIVLDEEHEWSYKQQDPSPRYHARDAARGLAALTDAVVVLGSATPDVVSYFRAKQGRYRLLRLPYRATEPNPPTPFPQGKGEMYGGPHRSADDPMASVEVRRSLPVEPNSRRSVADLGAATPYSASPLTADSVGAAPAPTLPPNTTGPQSQSGDIQFGNGQRSAGEKPIAERGQAHLTGDPNFGSEALSREVRPDLQQPNPAGAPPLPPERGRGQGGGGLPPITIVDLAAELRAGNRGMFSRALDAALTRVLRDGEQAILFLNRRGSASFVLCRDCGHVPRCNGCLVPLTYHARAERLRCHYCNRQRRVPERCPQCSSTRIRFLGLGTQRVEEEVRQRFPSARVLRWDRDAAKTGADHEKLLAAFAGREADVLVGTQMIAKGLDLPGVTLVGVVCADVALNLPHYRSGERAFQVLTQVAGRAGRGDRPGRVIVQTYAPTHHAIRAAAEHDYEAMYQAEIALRRRAGYPPFGRLAKLVYAHTNAGHAELEARRMADELTSRRTEEGIPAAQVIGPAPAFHSKLRGRWRWQIVIRATNPAELLAAVDLPRGWMVDVDPASLV